MKVKLKDRWAPVVYFVLGQAGWFACVLSAARGLSFLGIVFVVMLLALHLMHAERPGAEFKLIAAVALLGGVWESALVNFGLLEYPHSTLIAGLAPLWIIALWSLFAAQFNTTYGWLKHRLWAGVLLGAFAGPLSFRAGAALDALRFVKVIPAAVAIAIGWSVLLPLVIVLSKRWDGVNGAKPRNRHLSVG